MLWVSAFEINVNSVLAKLKWISESGVMTTRITSAAETLETKALYSFSEKGRSFTIKVVSGKDTAVLSKEPGSDSARFFWGSQLLWLPMAMGNDTAGESAKFVLDTAFVENGDTMCVLKPAEENLPVQVLVNYSKGELVKSEFVSPWGPVRSFGTYSPDGNLESIKVVTQEGSVVEVRFSAR